MVSDAHIDPPVVPPAADVDALLAEVGPGLDLPDVTRRELVLVTGPWMAGVSGVLGALGERLPQDKFVESSDLGPGDAPLAVVFVVSAAAPLTESDCVLLDAAAEHTDVVTAVVAKIDVHRDWRDVLAANRETLAAHAPRYGAVPWVGVAAMPDLGEPIVDELVETVAAQLSDSAIARRNRWRSWESRLHAAAQRFDREADGAGRRARVEALRAERSTALRELRQLKSQRTVALRAQIQQARVQLSHLARNRCSALRGELQQQVAGLSRRKMPGFEATTRNRVAEVVSEVSDGTTKHLADVVRVLDAPVTLPSVEKLPTVDVPVAPQRSVKSPRPETWLMALLGAGFGLGVALTLTRLVAGMAPRLNRLAQGAGTMACVAIGLAATYLVVTIRALLRDRAVLDRWAGEVTSSLHSVVEEFVATRVVAAESLLSTALIAHDEAENARVSAQVSVIDGELREHATAAARAAAERDREMPSVTAALTAVRAALADTETPRSL